MTCADPLQQICQRRVICQSLAMLSGEFSAQHSTAQKSALVAVPRIHACSIVQPVRFQITMTGSALHEFVDCLIQCWTVWCSQPQLNHSIREVQNKPVWRELICVAQTYCLLA